MKFHILILLLLLQPLVCSAQNLTQSEKKIWKKALNRMEETDQLYRKLMVNSPEMTTDSIWKLQTSLDSINKFNFISLTSQYGYPSRNNIGREASLALILHFTTENDFNELKELFKSELDKGNMLPEYYAWWFDRCQKNMNKPIFYGQYTNQKEFCGDEWIIFNQRRKEIELEPLKGKATCD